MKTKLSIFIIIALTTILFVSCSSPNIDTRTEEVDTGDNAVQTQESIDKATKEAMSAMQTQQASIEQTKSAEELAISQTQSALPTNCVPGGIYEDLVGDVEIDDLDILKVETLLENDLLTIVLYLKTIPREITFNPSEDNPNYYWGVGIDVDDDPSTGGFATFFGTDLDYEMFMPPDFMGEQPQTFAFNEFPAFFFEAKGDTLTTLGIATTSVDYDKNTISISGNIPNINENSKLFFLTRQRGTDSIIYTDTLCEY